MTSTPQIQSITDQILDRLYEYLSQDGEIPSEFIEALRQVGANGKMVESAAILGAIASTEGDNNENH